MSKNAIVILSWKLEKKVKKVGMDRSNLRILIIIDWYAKFKHGGTNTSESHHYKTVSLVENCMKSLTS